MNFLAHLLLSPQQEEIIIGNLAGDFLRGCDKNSFSPLMQQGISLHFAIDSFADQHPVVKESVQRLRSDFRLISGVFVDIFYDHFLAIDFASYSTISLPEFCDYINKILQDHETQLPPDLQKFLPVILENNILSSYYDLEGIESALQRIYKRTSLEFSVSLAMEKFRENYDSLQNDFAKFFPCLVEATQQYRAEYQSFLHQYSKK